jgi:tetratricopeptide (TPR) repeat protein
VPEANGSSSRRADRAAPSGRAGVRGLRGPRFGTVSARIGRTVLRSSTLTVAVCLAMLAGCSQAPRNPQPSDLPEPSTVSVEGLAGSAAETVYEALTAFQAAPLDPEANGLLAMTLDAQGRLEGAAVYYERARRLAPGALRWNHLLGLTLLSLGRPQEAVEPLQAALDADPGYQPSRRALASALLETNRAEQARRLYEAALQAQPNDSRALHGLSRALTAVGESDAALAKLEQAVEIAPDLAAARYELALAYRDAGRAEDSRRHLRLYEADRHASPPADDRLRGQVLALRMDPTRRLARAAELEAAGDFTGALAEHLAALKEDPALVQAHINLIALYGRMGQAAEARRHYGRALELAPDRAELHYNLGVLEVAERRIPEAERAFRKAVELNPGYAAALTNLGQTLEARGVFSEAARMYERAVAARPDYALGRFHWGRMLLGQGRADQAAEQFRRALEPESPQTPEVWFGLAAAYAKLGRREEAREAAERAKALAIRYERADVAAAVDKELERLR